MKNRHKNKGRQKEKNAPRKRESKERLEGRNKMRKDRLEDKGDLRKRRERKKETQRGKNNKGNRFLGWILKFKKIGDNKKLL